MGTLELSFEGLKTGDYINPSEASALYLELAPTCKIDADYQKLMTIIDKIVNECLSRALITKEQLGRCFIGYDHGSKTYMNRKLNVALI